MVASCWLFLNDLYYDARIHEHHIYSLFASVKTVTKIWLGISFLNSLLCFFKQTMMVIQLTFVI